MLCFCTINPPDSSAVYYWKPLPSLTEKVNVMLELRPTCEHCNKRLPPESLEAMICSYECTFCNTCVDNVLQNVCPNCGGGFCKRPIRPRNEWKSGSCLTSDPASTQVKYRPVNIQQHKLFADKIKNIPAGDR